MSMDSEQIAERTAPAGGAATGSHFDTAGALCLEIASGGVAGARALHDRLVEQLEPGRDTVLRIAPGATFDASGVQLLLAVKLWLEGHGRALSIAVSEGPALNTLRTSGAAALLTIVSPGDIAPGEEGVVS
jgi:hypothetical protein